MPFQNEFYETEPPKVKIIQDGGIAHVWLSREIQKDTRDPEGDSPAFDFWTAETLHYTEAGTPTVEEIEADFDVIVERQLAAEKTSEDRIAELEQANADFQAALLEIGDIVGEEE